MFSRFCAPSLAGVLLFGFIAFSSAHAGITHPDPTAREGLAALPIQSQASISAVLGRDQDIYHARVHGKVLHLDNPRHGLTALFTARGAEVQSRGAGLRLHFGGVGRGARREASVPERPEAVANRVAYRRRQLTEWYVNGPLGLEQGFTLTESPGRATGEALTIALSLGGELRPEPVSGGMEFVLRDGTVVLRYRGLVAWDATGRELPAWWQSAGRELALRVDDSGARYPVTVDPLIEEAKLTASDGAAGDSFGFSVAVDGDTLVVGAPFKDIDGRSGAGAAYVFLRPAGGFAGALQENARLTASDGGISRFFGGSVAVSGDTIVVGVGNFDSAAYVFVKPAGGWAGQRTEDAKLIPSGGGISSVLFHEGVAVSGDTVVVGAAFTDIGGHFDQGAAFVFVKPPAGWAGTLPENAMLSASDGAVNVVFGFSVAVSRDTVVIGAPTLNLTLSDSNQAAAYVFVEPPGGWVGPLTENAKLTHSDVNVRDFGMSVDVSGDTVVTAGLSSAVFVKPVGGWAGVLTESAKPNLGIFPVAISGDTVAAREGRTLLSLQVYRKPSGGWAGTVAPAATFTASDSGVSGSFGSSVALSGNTLVAGAFGDDIGGWTNQGSAYVFDASRVEAEPAPRADCRTTGCGLRVTCNLPPAQGIGCDTRVRLLVRPKAARLRRWRAGEGEKADTICRRRRQHTAGND
ncbi:MAG: hypothetical protein ACREXJ_02430 [Gammaproteobacteria bacterium]